MGFPQNGRNHKIGYASVKICILHIGSGSSNPAAKHLPSPDRFRNLLRPRLPGAHWTTINCITDQLPDNPSQFDAYLITGGKYSVYDDYEWQMQLFEFIRELYSKYIPLLGICYGHQAIAHVLGGKVERSTKGWGVGIVSIDVVNSPHWLVPSQKSVSLLSMHQDQVVRLPQDATQFMKSDHCEHSGFYVKNRVLGIQQHPDFTKELCRDLIIKRKELIGWRYQSALGSLAGDHEGEKVSQWIANFFKIQA